VRQRPRVQGLRRSGAALRKVDKEHRRLTKTAQRAGERSEPGATMFFLDPCGNALEFKAFADPARLFAN
jgi:extradiol dioxygenase family protein